MLVLTFYFPLFLFILFNLFFLKFFINPLTFYFNLVSNFLFLFFRFQGNFFLSNSNILDMASFSILDFSSSYSSYNLIVSIFCSFSLLILLNSLQFPYHNYFSNLYKIHILMMAISNLFYLPEFLNYHLIFQYILKNFIYSPLLFFYQQISLLFSF